MTGVEIDGKQLETIKTAADATGYSRDYITRLAREGKVIASQIGRQWYVDLDSLKEYEEATALEQKARQQQLSEERKQERSIRRAHDVVRGGVAHHTLSPRAKKAAVATGALAVMVGTIAHFAPELAHVSESASASLISKESEREQAAMGEQKNHATEQSMHEKATARVVRHAALQNGMLLLPYASSSVTEKDLAEFFSDDVRLEIGSDGQSYVIMTNEEGSVIERIPVMFAPAPASDTL